MPTDNDIAKADKLEAIAGLRGRHQANRLDRSSPERRQSGHHRRRDAPLGSDEPGTNTEVWHG